MIDVGVTTRSFTDWTNARTAEFLAEHGFTTIELCLCQTDSRYWVYNGRSDLSTLTDRRSRDIVGLYRDRGISIASLGVFTNLIESDPGERARNLAYYERMMEIAALNAIPCVPTECGFRPGRRGLFADSYEEDFALLLESLAWLVERARRHGVVIALEPCVLDIVPSAKRAADLLTQAASDRIGILLDPANLIAANSEEEMFAHLAPHIACLHGKDRKVNDRMGRALGEGDIDWPAFFRLYHRHTEGKPFILEYVNAGNVCAVRDRVRQADTPQ